MNQNSNLFQMDVDRELIARGVPSQHILEIRVQAPKSAGHDKRPHLNLALVLDRSGSMSGDKLSYVKKAAKHVLTLLQEQDSVAVVTYDDEVDLVSPSVSVTDENRREITRRISLLKTGGSTNLSGGWFAGCKEAAATAGEGTLNRALLLTDGLANAGIIDLEELARHAKELSRRGISTSTFGVGEGFNEHLLEAMSNQGGGNFYYIDTPQAIPDLFLREFAELAAVTASDVEISLNFPSTWKLEVPGGWRTHFSEGNLRIFLGNLVSGQTQEIYIRLAIPSAGEPAEMALNATVSGKGENGSLFENKAQVVILYAEQAKVDAAPQKREIVERFALVYLAEIANDSLKLERHGENDKASRQLIHTTEEYRNFISREEAQKFQEMADRMKRGMEEHDRKQSHFNTYNQKRGKQQP